MKKLLLSLCMLPVVCLAQPGYVNTIAGNGTSGFSGDGGLATAAQMGQVLGSIVIDGIGNLYFPDNDNGRIRKIAPNGIITTIAGGGSSFADGVPATSESLSLNAAGTIAMDHSGNIYFADSDRIRKVTIATGIITTVVGTGVAGFSGDGGPATAARINYPVGICFDASGNMYVGDETNARIRKVNTSGIISTYAGTGALGFSGDGGLATAAVLRSPDGLCVDAFGNLYFADRYNYRIRKITPSGIISTYAGSGSSGFCGDGGPATAACFAEPSNVRMDLYGNLYIADFHNGRIREVTPAGIVSTLAGGGYSMSSGVPATAESFTDVWGIGLDDNDNIYIPDRNNYRICRVGVGIPTVTADSFSVVTNKTCTGINFEVITNSYSPFKHVKTYLGNGISPDTTLSVYGTQGICTFSKSYNTGTYTIKHVLYIGTAAIDSITYTEHFSECQNFNVSYYFDENANCVKDNNEPYFFQNVRTEVDSSGIAIDTVVSTSGFNYLAYGSGGTVYSFKVLSMPTGIHVSCPSAGIVNDTIITGTEPAKYIGLACTTTSSFDMALHAITVVSGIRDQWGHIYLSNTSCDAPHATLSVRCSPIYTFVDGIPMPSSMSGNTGTWYIDTLSALTNNPIDIVWGVGPVYPGSAVPGDTTYTSFVITPFAGDADTTNNSQIIIDTVRAGCDPNEMWVSPNGCIDTSVTQLQYTLHFENTGNDTAFNIYVLDTLSPYVNPSTMNIVTASSEMYLSKLKGLSGQIILKFDFPNINLLDSSHHGLCDGAIIFTIKTLPELPLANDITNRAGVYFDYNAVVMTNTVETVVGCAPTFVQNIVAPENIKVYPNPATDELTIKMDKDAYNSYTITNTVGQTMLQQTLNATLTKVSVKMLPTGVYYITFRGDNGTKVEKFVKM